MATRTAKAPARGADMLHMKPGNHPVVTCYLKIAGYMSRVFDDRRWPEGLQQAVGRKDPALPTATGWNHHGSTPADSGSPSVQRFPHSCPVGPSSGSVAR